MKRQRQSMLLPWRLMTIIAMALQKTVLTNSLMVGGNNVPHKQRIDHLLKMQMTSTTLQIKLFDSLEEMLFPSENNNKVFIDPTKELVSYSFAVKDDDMDVARSSLEHFLNQWAFNLATDSSSSSSSKNNGLSTPISAGQFQDQAQDDVDDDDESSSSTNARLRIMFRPPPRYLSYNEQKRMEKGTLPDRKGAKLDSKSPGGVDIRVRYNNNALNDDDDDDDDDNNTILLVARRCCFDSDTILKESSERAIVRRLDEAMRIWKKVRAMKV
jgi:hypothetical protein